ncbi:hypothetical protein Poli38472_002657 [Pythium oligandrum]|uniref:Uncharacterized protein n=1 Tax=Pythium oligandrum TaxID=41045 RepID=A0A8K1CJ68_PYTOL|nr:hypothetical protein Poli38472_002657 [Pythium oligandrum]|eukprot:TMW63716.1 hypothetical protein Poli38472_002657 [Pythium oligandrum]
MLEGDARRTLEEEAIALVNLSTSHLSKRDMEATSQMKHVMTHHPRVQVHASLRHEGTSVSRPMSLQHPVASDLSMSVFVNGQGKLSAMSGGKTSPDHHAAFEISSLDPVAKNHQMTPVKMEGSDGQGVKRAHCESPTSPVDDKNISMQSLLVTLKKRKLEDSNEATASCLKLPSFRDVFNASKQQQVQERPRATATSPTIQDPQNSPSRVQAEEAHQQTLPAGVIPPPELKCKYRTGKCNNIRALKSCGDYHNLCNYHRLRANANQRKLDRKKKVQRQQVTTGPHSGHSSPIAASSHLAAPPAAAAAAALASLPTAFMMSRSVKASREPVAASFMPFLIPATTGASRSSSFPVRAPLRPKEENAC